jgi:SAM-dependent methyltransferase
VRAAGAENRPCASDAQHHVPERPPSHLAALAQYRRRAPLYDLELLPFEPIRRMAIARLALHPGETVLDLGCGTGLSFDQIEADIGPLGRIVGVEQSPEMIELARRRVARGLQDNVTLLGDPVEAACIPGQADAALFHFTHDIVCSPAALANVMAHLRPGARVVATGLQWAPWWAWPVNQFVQLAALHSVSSLAGLERPWRTLESLTTGLQVNSLWGGGIYIASGVVGEPA